MLEIGSLVDGKYKILNVVGKGGMSVVYLAMNERANKQWAIKEVRKDGVQDFEVVKQNLIVETDILKNLNHPNLPSIIDVIDREDSFLIVMDYIEGKALSDVLKEYGAQPQEYVIEWAKQLCDVLGYLHSRVPPIIYRDMKPSNVMLKPDGNLTLIDFGTAREFKASKVEDTTCLGTRGYAAPEQYGGHGQTDGRTDIYCLGATMYHLVTGHNPSQPPYEMYPIRNWDPNLSSGLEEIIIKCTKYNPEDRYQNCQELMYALEHYDELDDRYRNAQKKKMRIFTVTAALTVMFGIGAIFGGVQERKIKKQSYQAWLDRAQTSTTLSEKAGYYAQAIRLNPRDKDAYMTMIDDLVKDEEFSSDEEQAVASAIHARNGNIENLEYLKKDREGFTEFSYEMGINYFFKFKGNGGKAASRTWFQYVLSVDNGYIDSKQKKRAEIYDRIASYYESLGKEDKSGEKATAGYSNFFKDLVELNKNELTDMGNNTTAITLYNEIANQIGANTNGHKNDAEGTLNSDFVFRKGSEHASLLDFYDYVTFGYFTKGKIAVVIEAHDDVSGIQYVDVDIDGESSERHLISDTAKGNGMTHKSGNTWGTIIIKDADYKGKIKAKPTDMSGNTASKYTEPRGVISETQSQHNKAKTMKITTLTKPSNTANGINYYNRSVAVNISMGDSHSGLKSWGYTAGTAVKDNKNYGEAAGTTDKNGNPTVNNVYSMNKTVTMAAGDTNYTNKDNPTMVETEFEDNAGWTEKANEKYVIDDKKPIIKVDWTSSANVMNEKYYKATRVAHITVTERNFNEAGVDWQINNETGVVKSGWSHNGDTHTCDVSFTKDGDFILNFKITDYAMNSDSYKGEEFTIDKTAPVISISFDRNNPSNGYYFNTPRTATLHIEEHNFAAKDVTYELSGSNDGKGIGSPTAGGWSTGSDHHTASIYYGSDGEFSLNFNYTDMAGNPANKIQTEKFVIDLTKPVCKITNVEDHAAYNGKVAPGIEYSDTNLDENQVTVKLVGNKVGNASYEKNAPVSIHNGRTVQWKDFARKEKVDDIYTMELTIKDKAGNESTDKKVFSVNRFGSNYIFGTDTQALLDKIYSNQEIPVEVREINVNSLKEKAISVKNEDNEITELQAGSDYTVTEGNDKYKWKEYRYVINGDVFAQESEYNVTLSSKDAAANEMNNVAKNKDIDFIIDKTNPTGIVSGLEESSYKEDSHKINVRAMDNYQLDEAVLYVDGSEYKTFASEDFQGDKGVEVTLDSKNKPQEIYLSLTDKAGNSVDLKKTQCLITSNAWIQYINNKPLFYSTVGGGAALIIAILGIATRGFGYASSMAAQSGFWWTILGKRREDEDED